ncbi:MAG TPA: ATP-binding protein [Anaerolineales bacterium]
MTIELWAIDSAFLLAAPLRSAGYLQLALMVIWLLSLIVPPLVRRANGRSTNEAGETGLLLALVFVAPLAELLLIGHIPGSMALPGVPRAPISPAFSLLGALPWMAAAGLMGAPQAALVAFAGGLARGGWITGSLMTPVSMALQAALAASLLVIPYRESAARLFRRPLGAGIIAGLLFGVLRAGELFAHTGGSLYDGLNFTLTLLPATLAGGLLEGLLAGGTGELIRARRPQLWRQPAALRAAPYNRTLATRLLSAVVLVGVAAAVGLAAGQWLLAREAVAELFADGMRRTAEQAGNAVPFFIQTGRATVRQLANEASPMLGADPQTEPLETLLAADPVFDQLFVVGADGVVIARHPAGSSLPQLSELATPLALALEGVPQEVTLRPLGLESGAGVVFLAPVGAADGSQILGVVAGWASLADHPLLRPVRSLIEQPAQGEVILVDGQGTILLHVDPAQVMGSYPLESASVGQVVLGSAPDGTRRLELVHGVTGSDWRIVTLLPQRVIDQTAMPIAGRLLAVLTGVGLIFVAFIYWSSQRLTQPLRQMAEAAGAIAEGNLDRPVDPGGEDEVGQLAGAFERMRTGLKSRLDQMDLLLRVSQSLAADLALEQSLPPVLEGLRAMTGSDVARLSLGAGPVDGSFAPEARQAGGAAGHAQLDSQLLALSRQRGPFALENPARARAVLDLGGIHDDLGALMAAPVRTEDGFAGALWLARARRQPYSAEDRNLLAIISAQLGVWLANVALFQQAEEERQRLGAVLEVTPDAVIAVDGLGRVTLANPAAGAVLTIPPAEAIDRPADEVVTSPDVRRLLAEGPDDDDPAEIQLEGGRVLSASIRQLGLAGRPSTGRLCVLWDITYYKKLDMLKSEFVSTVSHDLRAPLTLMRGYSTMISMVGALNEQQKEFVTKILDSIDGMGQLVENLLDLGRIDAGLGLELQPVELAEIVQEVVDNYRPTAVNKQVSLEVEMPANGIRLLADRTLLRQAIANLVDNAIKYTSGKGKVRIEAEQLDDRWRLEVIDTGLGIAPADQAHLFERFYRARRPESLKTRGSGLGLAIVKSIVEQHGGQVGLDSRLGSGSTFFIEVPLDPATVLVAGAQPALK